MAIYLVRFISDQSLHSYFIHENKIWIEFDVWIHKIKDYGPYGFIGVNTLHRIRKKLGLDL